MKSRYICMFACLWGLGFLFSCDGFLNENPKDKIPEEDAYKNLTDLYYNAGKVLARTRHRTSHHHV